MGKLMILERKPIIDTNSQEYIKLLETIIKTIRESGIDFNNNYNNDDDCEPAPA